MTEEAPPYGSGNAAGQSDTPSGPRARRVRTHHLLAMKQEHTRWSMLTSYDQFTAAIFDEAGVEALLVGDSAGNNVLGYETTLPVTVEDLLPLVRAVSGAARRALVIADLPFGSYQRDPGQAFDTAVRFMKEGRAHAVKLEGGASMAPTVARLTSAGIPVMAHIGFTPQSEHALGGYKVQGRGSDAAELIADAEALQDAGAFAVVMEMVPAPLAARVTAALQIPTVGIGAGPDCDAQVLVWQDFAGLRGGRMARFVKQYADLRGTLLEAARDYRADVVAGTFPGPEHSFEK